MWASQVTLEVKNPPANAGGVREAGSIADEDPLEEGMATRSRILAWRIPIERGACGLQSMVLQWVRHNWNDLALTHA